MGRPWTRADMPGSGHHTDWVEARTTVKYNTSPRIRPQYRSNAQSIELFFYCEISEINILIIQMSVDIERVCREVCGSLDH